MAPSRPLKKHTSLSWRLPLLGALIAFTSWSFLDLESSVADLERWLPDSSVAVRDYLWFTDRFGTDDALIVSWEGCEVGDPRIERFRQRLAEQDERGLIRTVLSGPSVLRELTDGASGLDEEEARRRLTGTLFGPDGETTLLVLRLSEEGHASRVEVLEAVFAAADRVAGLGRKQLRMAGYPFAGYAANLAVRDALLVFTPIACLASVVAAWFCLRNLFAVGFTLLFAGGCTAFAIALVPATGHQVDALLAAMPALIYVLAVSGCLHFLSYLGDAAGEVLGQGPDETEDLAGRGFRVAWKPSLVSAVSTATGMASLGISDFPAIRDFGLYSATATMAGFVFLLVFAPGPLAWCVTRGGNHFNLPRPLRWVLSLCQRLSRRFSWGVLATSAVAALLLAAQLPSMTASVAIEGHYRPDSDFIVGQKWLEKKIGPSTAVEVVLSFPESDSSGFANRLFLVRDVKQALAEVPGVSGVFSALSPVPVPEDPGGVFQRAVLRQRLAPIRDDLLAGDYLAEDEGRELWRLSIRSSALADRDLDRFDAMLRDAADEVLSGSGSDVRQIHTGIEPLYFRSQAKLISDLYQSYTLAFVVIGVLMAAVFRSVAAGAASMYPNLLPTVFVFGAITAAGMSFDFATIVTGSVALGVAVDDTAHFLLRYREIARRQDPASALARTFRQCGPAMTATSLVCTFGLLSFAVSPLATQGRFALSIAFLFLVALLCDLLVVPAMLATGIGRRIFRPTQATPGVSTTPVPSATGVKLWPEPSVMKDRGDRA